MEEKNEQKTREFRGLYKHVKISVKTLDKIIIACVAVIIIVVAIDLRNPGFTITFDSNGGSEVAAVTVESGHTVTKPADPTKEGYTFVGWSKSSTATTASYFSGDIISFTENTTLYAVWKVNIYLYNKDDE